MKRILLVTVVLSVLSLSSALAGVERKLRGRLRGAWVVTSVETYSDCQGTYTDNRVNGRLVSSRGRVKFRRGELAKIDKINAKRTRLDLHLSLAEPVLRSHQDGPFTLYDEARCRIEIEVKLPRDLVRREDIEGIERFLAPVIRRFFTEDEARQSRAYNRRERDPYPEDYDKTLAEHAAWKAYQFNDRVQARLDIALTETTEVGATLSSDPAYLSGFARGVEAGRSVELKGCPQMMALNLNRPRRTRTAHAAAKKGASDSRSERGFRDGRRLVLGLELLRRLPGCFVPVPEVRGSDPWAD